LRSVKKVSRIFLTFLAGLVEVEVFFVLTAQELAVFADFCFTGATTTTFLEVTGCTAQKLIDMMMLMMQYRRILSIFELPIHFNNLTITDLKLHYHSRFRGRLCPAISFLETASTEPCAIRIGVVAVHVTRRRPQERRLIELVTLQQEKTPHSDV
jgi:hypothetical protein